MFRSKKHHRSLAGTSFTKARVAIRCCVMRPVVNYWTQQTTGSGSLV